MSQNSHLSKIYRKYFPWLVCFVAALFYSYEFVLRVAPTVMVEDFRSTFFLNGSGIGFLLSCYSFGYTPLQLPAGPLMDYYGPRKLLLLAILLCCVGSFLIPLSVNLYVTQISLFLIGFGSAFAFVGVLKLAINWLPNKYFAFISGLTTTLGMLGAIFGQKIMNTIVSNHGWLYAWKISGEIGIVLFILIYLFIYDCPKSKVQNKSFQKHLNIIAPLKEFRTLLSGNHQFLLNAIIGGILFLPISVFGSSWGVEFLKYVFSFNYNLAANSVPFVFVGLGIGAPSIGWLCAKYKKSRIFLQVSAAGLFLLFVTLILIEPVSPYMIQFILFIIGLFVSPQILVFYRSVVFSSSRLAGMATASTNFIVMIPAMLYPIIIGFLLDIFSAKHSDQMHEFTRTDFQYAMAIVPISLFLAFILLFFAKETKLEK